MKISAEEFKAFTFLHVPELKVICCDLGLSDKGKKGGLISRIVNFLQTGTVLQDSVIPEVSKAQKGQTPSLSPEALMLKGAYKNDLATRLFLKSLIGDHFHFTAFGIDFLNDRWMTGDPPTYQEFADMWQMEYDRRKDALKTPKDEWAYIKFTQTFLKKHSQASRPEILAAWDQERLKQKSIVTKLLKAWRLG